MKNNQYIPMSERLGIARVRFEKAKSRLDKKGDFLGINSRRLASVVMKNREGVVATLTHLANKAKYATTLETLIEIHKCAFKILQTIDCPLQLYHLGPDMYGMFRVNSIDELDVDNCYLGNIHGLRTCTVRTWEQLKERDMFAYNLVKGQYVEMIVSNVMAAINRVNRETLKDVQKRHQDK